MAISKDNKEESSEELFFNFIESETVDQAWLFEAVNKELEAFLVHQTIYAVSIPQSPAAY